MAPAFMIAIGYVFDYFGFPLFFGDWAEGWRFLIGAGMPLMMLGMYVGPSSSPGSPFRRRCGA